MVTALSELSSVEMASPGSTTGATVDTRPGISRLAFDDDDHNAYPYTSIAEVEEALANLESEETCLLSSLRTLSLRKDHLENASRGLEEITPEIDQLITDGSIVFEKVATASTTAERVSERIKSLDVEQECVKEVLAVIQHLQDLKLAIHAIHHALEKEDWQTAAVEVNRARQIPHHILTSQFAQDALPTADIPDLPGPFLEQAIEKLSKIFVTSFESATRTTDEAQISLYFRLFPLVGKADVGLSMYSKFVCGLVAGRTQGRIHQNLKYSERDTMFFAGLLNNLFENIALIVTQHEQVILKHYGSDCLRTVLDELLKEADRQGLAILRRWSDDRRLDHKLTMISQYDFSWLNQTKRLTTKGRPRRSAEITVEESMVDSRDIDQTLGEMSKMVSQWALFHKFMLSHAESDQEPAMEVLQNGPLSPHPPRLGRTGSQTVETPQSVTKSIQLATSQLGQKLDEEMGRVYAPLESWFLRKSLEKAHQLDEPDPVNLPTTSSVVDDTFYVLKKIIYRVAALGSLPRLTQLISDLSTILKSDFGDLLARRIDNLDIAQTTLSREMESDKERQFMIYANDLETSSGYIVRLLDETDLSHLVQRIYISTDAVQVLESLASLKTLKDYFQGHLRPYINEYFIGRFASRLTRLINESFKDVTYSLDEDSFENAEVEDLFHRHFCQGWRAILGRQSSFIEGTQKYFIGLCIKHVAHAWAKQVALHRFTELGALKFDQDVRAVSHFLVSQYGLEAKDHLRRLFDISAVLNLEDSDSITELEDSSLSRSEAETILALKL